MVVILLLVMTILFCFSRFDLNLTSVRTEDAGEYFCLVNNKVAAVYSIYLDRNILNILSTVNFKVTVRIEIFQTLSTILQCGGSRFYHLVLIIVIISFIIILNQVEGQDRVKVEVVGESISY